MSRDAWKANWSLTINLGVRYENFRPLHEANGLPVLTPTVPLEPVLSLSAMGESSRSVILANQLSDFTLSYALNGPANGKPSWWSPDNTNFAPRIGMAFSPADNSGILGKMFVKSGAFRIGGAIAYDQFGNDLVTQFDQFGSLGLTDPTNFPDSYSFTTSPRFTGTFPALPPAAAGGFPYTPPPIAAITGTFLGISPDLKTPYSIVLNASFAREMPGKRRLVSGGMGWPRRFFVDGVAT